MSGQEWGVVIAAVATIGWVNWYFFVAGRGSGVAVAAAAATGDEVVIIVDGGYSPNTIRAKRGVATRLVFDRKDESGCSEEVVFPEFGIRKYLPSGERTTIEIKSSATGKFPFTCGMSMLRGTLIVED